MINCLCSFLPVSSSSIIGPVVGGVIGGFIFVIIVVICCIAAIVIIKHHKSHIRTTNSQQIEFRSAGTIQSNSASYPLAQQLPPAYPQQPPAQYPYLIPPAGNTVYPDQEINMEPKTLRTLPPPSYDDLYKN